MKLTIDTEKLSILKEQGGKLLFEKDAEMAIIKAVHLRNVIEDIIDNIKGQIIATAQEDMPNFSGVYGEQVKATYRFYGSKYEIEDPEKAKDFIETKTSYTVKSKDVDEYLEATGKLPEGIIEKGRVKQLSFNETDIKEYVEKLEDSIKLKLLE